jgi:hypothetical protein
MEPELGKRKARYAFYSSSIVVFWAIVALVAHGFSAGLGGASPYWIDHPIKAMGYVVVPLIVVAVLASMIAEISDSQRRRKRLKLLMIVLLGVPIGVFCLQLIGLMLYIVGVI